MRHFYINRAQREALLKLWRRIEDSDSFKAGHGPRTYREFRRQVRLGWDCIMVPALGIWMGIETDGYTHS